MFQTPAGGGEEWDRDGAPPQSEFYAPGEYSGEQQWENRRWGESEPMGNDQNGWEEWEEEMVALKKGVEQLQSQANGQARHLQRVVDGCVELERLNQQRLNGLQQQISEEKDIRHEKHRASHAKITPGIFK